MGCDDIGDDYKERARLHRNQLSAELYQAADALAEALEGLATDHRTGQGVVLALAEWLEAREALKR